jgi:hypothetical protein
VEVDGIDMKGLLYFVCNYRPLHHPGSPSESQVKMENREKKESRTHVTFLFLVAELLELEHFFWRRANKINSKAQNRPHNYRSYRTVS